MQHQLSEQEVDTNHSKVSAVLIERVIKLKQKETAAKKTVHFWGIFIFVIIAFFLFFGWYNYPSVHFNLTTLLQATRNTVSMIAFSLFVIGVGKLHSAKKNYDKAEEEFEQLREEIIDRQEQLWDTKKHWENRSELFFQIEMQHGINLFHK